MAPDPKNRLPRELLKELIEEGSEAFRGVLEKLLNTAMQMEREEFLGARRWERSEQRRDHANGYKDKTLSTRVGQLRIRIPQVRHLDFYPRSLERGCRSEKALKLAIAEMYVMGVSTRKVTEITEQLCGTEISASQVSRISKLLDDELEKFRNRPLGNYPVVYLDAHRGGPHRLDHLAAFLRWTPQFLLPPVREILRGGEPEGKVPLRMFFQASVHLLRRRPSVRRVRSLAVV